MAHITPRRKRSSATRVPASHPFYFRHVLSSVIYFPPCPAFYFCGRGSHTPRHFYLTNGVIASTHPIDTDRVDTQPTDSTYGCGPCDMSPGWSRHRARPLALPHLTFLAYLGFGFGFG